MQTTHTSPITTKTQTTFRQVCRVTVRIAAPTQRVWELLTNLDRFTEWNSTVDEIKGKVAMGETIAIKSKAAPGRTFKPKVTSIEPLAMVWSDGLLPMFQGTRTYKVREVEAGITEFEMTETFKGALLPMIRRSLPDFAPIFDTYANDLKREAELAA